MKTLNDWKASKKCLSSFLQPGDAIDNEIADYMLCVLPPATWRKDIIQMGEPFDSDSNGKARYLTIEKSGDNWIYTGIKVKPNN